MPTFKLYVDGKVVKMIVGASADKIRAGLDELYEIQGFEKSSDAAPAAAPAAAGTTTAATAAAAPAAATDAAPARAAKFGTVVELSTEEEFRAAIQESMCVVDFYAQWCGPCKQLAPYFKNLAAQYPNVKFCKIDFDDFEELGEEFNVASLPSLVFFKDGKKVHLHVGVSKEKIAGAFTEHYGAPQ
jgi:thioredoxin 1